MCGIVGIFSFNNFKEKTEAARKKASLFLFTELLETTSARGEDATGVTTLFDTGDYMIQKMGIASPKFISRFGNKASDFEGYLNLCRNNPNNIKALIGHCRKSSVGNTTDNENNHPIKAGEIVGIHNGTLKNHNKIFKKLDCDRDGVVDSEAIFRLIQHYTDNCKEPFTLEILEETVRRLEGSYSCITYNANNPYQIGVFRDGRPMEFALIKSLGLMIVTSEKKFINQAIYDYNKQVKLYKLGTPLIKSADVVFAMLPNDCVGIIDLTQKVNKDTNLTDLVLRKDVFKTPKLWKTAATTTNYYQGNSNVNTNKSSAGAGKAKTGAAAATGTADKTNTTEDKSSTKTTLDGKIFCKELNKYVSPEHVREAVKVGSVEISTNGNKAVSVEKIAMHKDIIEKVPNAVMVIQKDEPIKKDDPIKKVVDVSIDPEVVEASKNSRESLLKYSNNEDLAEDIGAVDALSVEAITAFALGNRIRKYTYENAFLDGAKFYKKFTAQDMPDEKLTKAQKVIRIAKRVIKVLALNSDLMAINVGSQMSDKECMKESLIEEDGIQELTVSSLNSLVTTGDKRDYPALTLLETVVKEETDGKESTVGKI